MDTALQIIAVVLFAGIVLGLIFLILGERKLPN